MRAWTQTGRIGDSSLVAQWRLYAGERFHELRLRVGWNERQRLLKLVLPVAEFAPTHRTDGIPGGYLPRDLCGRERPLRDWVHLANARGQSLAVLCPDVYAVDATTERVRFTLLRSPVMAHHAPAQPTGPNLRYSDRGEHEFRFRFYFGPVTPDELDATARMLNQPPYIADLTRGMPPI
jgi:alpha-mannosidase